MTNERYVFQQEVRERKDLARQAHYMKNGCKSKKCTLPSDYMTRKEKLAMNGEVISYNFSRFYTYEEFKALPDHAKAEYLNHLCAKYKVSKKFVAETVLGVSVKTLDSHLKRCGLMDQIKSYRSGTKADRDYLANKVQIIRLSDKAPQIFPDPAPTILGTLPSVLPDVPTREFLMDKDGNIISRVKKEPEPSITHMEFELNRFDFDFLELIKEQFAGKKVKLSISIDTIDES